MSSQARPSLIHPDALQANPIAQHRARKRTDPGGPIHFRRRSTTKVSPKQDSFIIGPVRALAWTGLVISGSLVLAAGYPWGEVLAHTHWAKVGWIPFSWPIRELDIAANLLLCLPLGFFAGLAFKRGVLIAGAIALPLSLFVETMQVYTHSRFPSATDVICNVAGAVFAALVVRGYRLRVSREASS